MIPETFDLKLIQETAEDFDRVAQFYRDAIDQTPEMERFGRWIYGLHPTDGMILDYIRSGVMYTCQGGGEIFCAFALTPSQGSDYHDTAWGLNFEDEQVAVVHLLCVNPKYQHQGIGKRAMAHAIALAEQMGKRLSGWMHCPAILRPIVCMNLLILSDGEQHIGLRTTWAGRIFISSSARCESGVHGPVRYSRGTMTEQE